MSRSFIEFHYAPTWDEAKWAEASYSCGARVRYDKWHKMFVVECLDFYDFSRLEPRKEVFKFGIREYDLLRLIRADFERKEDREDKYYRGFLKKEYDKSGKLVRPGVEQGELDDDTYLSISVCQYFFKWNARLVKVLCKRQAHLYKLGKVSSPWIELGRRVLHPNSGRPKGSKNRSWEKRLNEKLSRIKGYDVEEYERLVYLRDNYSAISAKCVERGDLSTWVALRKDLCMSVSEKGFYEHKKQNA